jgi:hypothetical protein
MATRRASALYIASLIGGGFLSQAHAQWAPNGVPLTLDPGVVGQPMIAPDGTGGAVVVWQDERDYLARGMDVYAQRVTADGHIAPGWLADGVPVCTDSAAQYQYQVASDGAGGAYIAWVDLRNYVQDNRREDIYLQRLTSTGAIASGWPVNGMPICNAPREQFRPQVALDGLGGVFVVWEDYRRGGWYNDSQTDIYAQRVTPAGEIAPGWPADGLPLCTFPGFRWTLAVMPDGLGGLFIAWTDYRGTIANDSSDLYALRIDEHGDATPGWVAGGVPICTAPGYQSLEFQLDLVADAQGGFIATWVDYRTAPPGEPNLTYYANIYAQRMTASGTVASGWPENGVPLCTAPDIQFDHEAVSDGAGGAVVAWLDWRNYLTTASDVYAQRVLASGEIATGWPADGVPLSRAPGFELSPTMVPDGAGGAIVAYLRREIDLYAQHVTSSGTIAPGWKPDGVSLCKFSSEDGPEAVSDGMGRMIVTWEDLRTGSSDIYAQRLGDDFPTPTLLSLVRVDAEPGRVTLTWNGGSTSLREAQVYRRATNSDWILLGATQNADGLLVFEDRAVGEGRYAYRLGYADETGEVHTPEVWVLVPSGHVLSLAGFSPNPAVGEPMVSFTMASDEPATLEVFDVSGRTVLAREVGSLGPGRHVLAIGRETRFVGGVYWVRLTQNGRALTAKGLVVR